MQSVVSGGLFFLNNKQQLEYLLRIRKIREVMVVKDNIHLTYKYKNRNQAFKQVENLQDKIINHVIDDVLYGNVGELKNIEKTTSKIINDTLVNERKRIHRIDDRFVNHAVKFNTEIYSKFFNNRLNNIKYSLQLRIEEELRKNSIRNLSDSEIRKILSEKYADTGKARLKNIVKDSIHTNESNISFIQALNEGYSYKVWMNGRSKGKTRPWHRARIIDSVPIDEYFDIYGSYHAELMYPGDLNGGAENVANCRCWLRYTNRTPSNLKKKSSFNIPPSSYLYGKNRSSSNQNALKVTSKIKNKITRTISTIGNKIKNTGSKITEKIEFKKSNTKIKQQKNKEKLNNLISLGIQSIKNKILNKRYIKYTTKDGKHTISIKEITDPIEFKKYLEEAYKSQPKNKSWRVDLNYTPEDYVKSKCKMYVTENGSTIAIKPDGDIISVCANISGMKDSTRALLEFAVKNGGSKFDSYSGNYGVYRYCGFEPRSWCEGVEEFYPDSWKKGHKTNPEKYKKEHIIFFEYTGKQSKYVKAKDFTSNDKYKGKDYDDAEKMRDKVMKK